VGVSWRLVVMISGTGSNADALLSSLDEADPALDVTVVAMGADREAEGLDYAAHRGIPTFITSLADYPSREEWGEALLRALESYSPDLIVLSGFMRLLPANVVERFQPRIINTHPAFLPEFPGAHGVRDALAAGVNQTGASVIVVDNGVDTGPILAQERVAIEPRDDEDSLHARIKIVERRLLFDVVSNIVTNQLDLDSLYRKDTPS
jgi:phosphoribosylglycinamide formyltransferase-1